jgi:diacylglycerol kinase family enzyme
VKHGSFYHFRVIFKVDFRLLDIGSGVDYQTMMLQYLLVVLPLMKMRQIVFSYYQFKITLWVFLGFESKRFELVVDGKVINRTAFLLSIANGSQYGNNAFIAPEADSSDGFLELVIVKSMKGWQAISFPYRLFTKKLKNGAGIEVKRFKKLEVITSYAEGHVDGEPIDLVDENRVEIVPKSLKILVPQK